MDTIKSWFDLKKIYIIVFITLAAWSIFAYVTITNLISNQDVYAKIINLSGKQRMLSQKTTLIAKRYFESQDIKLKEHLKELINTMEKDHKYILQNLRSDNLNNVYFKNPLNLNEKVINYISLLNKFEQNPSKELLSSIENISFVLLPKLNESVYLFEKESEEKTQDLLKRERFILIGTLLTLLLEAIFIVIPSIKIANKKEKELKEKIENAIKENRKKEKLLDQQFHINQMTEMIINIAHQWRQPLSVISSIASGIIVQKKLGVLDEKEQEKQMENILNKTQFLSSTIDNFNDFIKKDYNKNEFSLHNCINSTLAVLDSTFDYEKIKLFKDFYLEDLIIKGDESKLAQVLLNIITNAKDFLVIREIENKWISIKTFKENEFIYITIEDSAKGIDEKVIDKIFDIYFTTKHQSQGTGLGLYISYEVIQKIFKGKLWVENSEFGAKFTIELPIS
jgi:signal transduction histidine kinase